MMPKNKGGNWDIDPLIQIAEEGFGKPKKIMLNYSSTHYSERKLGLFSRNYLPKELCVYFA